MVISDIKPKSGRYFREVEGSKPTDNGPKDVFRQAPQRQIKIDFLPLLARSAPLMAVLLLNVRKVNLVMNVLQISNQR
jgi:hypothetical protein